MQKDFSYDTLPYTSYTFPQTRPDHLSAMTTFLGLEPAPPENCRVLELACGDGANLLSFAYSHRESSFMGIDLAENHIKDAVQAAAELELANISFLHEDIMNFSTEKYGKFDFIISHGLFSWVPDFVREKILQIYKECLNPNGVGYISYNTFPGCHLREVAWEMMRFHTSGIEDPAEKVRHAGTLLHLVNEAAEGGGIYHQIIQEEFAGLQNRTASTVFHDDLGESNQPFYFHEFEHLIRKNSMQYISEAFPTELRPMNVSAEMQNYLDSFGSDIVRREQYKDYIKGTRFRSSLICKDNLEIERDPASQKINDFYIASQVRTESKSPDLSEGVMETFLGHGGAAFTIDHALTKCSLVHLYSVWPAGVRFEHLIDKAVEMLPSSTNPISEEESAKTASALLEMFKAGFVTLRRHQPHFVSIVSEFPKASAFAQWQVKRDMERITSLTGLHINLERGLPRTLLLLLDGTRSRADLIKEMKEMIASGEINVPEDKKVEVESSMSQIVEFNLAKMAESALLEA